MTSRELENLVGTGQLKRTPANDGEIDALIRSGEARLNDAGNGSLALELDNRIVTDLISAAKSVRDALRHRASPLDD